MVYLLMMLNVVSAWLQDAWIEKVTVPLQALLIVMQQLCMIYDCNGNRTAYAVQGT
jgi:hypothetical protein